MGKELTVYTTKAWREDGWSLPGMLASWRSQKAKHLLERNGYAPKVIDVTNNVDLRADLEIITGTKALPQVFIDGSPERSKWRCGYPTLVNFERRGELDLLLQSDSSIPRQCAEHGDVGNSLAKATRLSLMIVIVCMILIAALWVWAADQDWPVELTITAAIVLICAATIGILGTALSSSSAAPFDPFAAATASDTANFFLAVMLLNWPTAGLIWLSGILLALVGNKLASAAHTELKIADIFPVHLPGHREDVPVRTAFIGMFSIGTFPVAIFLALSPGLDVLQQQAAVGITGAILGFWAPKAAKKSARRLVLSLLAVLAICFFIIFSRGFDQSATETLLTLLGALLLAGSTLLKSAKADVIVFFLASPVCLYIIFGPAIFGGPGFGEYALRVSTLFLTTSVGIVLQEQEPSQDSVDDRVTRRRLEKEELREQRERELVKIKQKEEERRERRERELAHRARKLEAEQSTGFWQRLFGK